MDRIYHKSLNHSGMVYFAALAVMAILMSFGLTYMYLTQTQIRISGNAMDYVKLFYLAEAGVEYSLGELICGYEDCSSDPDMKDGEALIDLDGDFNDDFEAHYNSAHTDEGEIKGRAFNNFGGCYHAIESKVNTSGIYGAVVGGGSLYFHDMTGKIDGNIDGTDHALGVDIPSTLTLYGTVTENDQATFSSTIPEADFSAYKTWAEGFDPSRVLSGETQDQYSEVMPLETTGMYFVDGDFTIDEPGFALDGTLVVNGNLFIESDADNITITGSAGHPALVVHYLGAATDVDGTRLENVNLGMVYARDSVSIAECDNMTINGALVARGAAVTAEISWANNFIINYDPELTLDSDYFSGGTFGYPKIVLWQGHEDIL